jgi:YHS domain-containing protein
MFPFIARLILFLIAISVVRSVVTFIQRAFNGTRPPQQPLGRVPGGPQETRMLKQDPVCGTYVAVDTSLKRVVNGQVLHFCSAECRDKYSI